ncbi:MAG: HEAT repeat domain-containing protein [Candidatus Wallbacteria bacterium]|nr:HEAT repeat domain-containing protein [Candidatus Wallbacteria bacterium]
MDNQLEILREDLTSFDGIVWKNAISKLAQIGSEEAKDILLKTLNDERPDVRSFTKKALEKIQLKDSESDFLIKLRTKIISADGKEVNAADFERILEGTPNYKKRILMIQETAKIKDKKVLPVLVKNLEKEKHPFVVATLVKAIGAYSDERLIPLLQQYLKHKDNRVRANTIEGLEAIGSQKVVPAVLKCLDDTDNRVKANAIKCLNHFGASEVKNALETMINSGNEESLNSAIFALRVISGLFAVEKLKGILESNYSTRVRFRAKNAMLELVIDGNENAINMVNTDKIFLEELYLENLVGLKDKSFFRGREITWVGEVLYVVPEDELFLLKDSISHERFALLCPGTLIETEIVEVEGEIVDFIDNSLPVIKARKVAKLV